ncbi:MAG: hypothetical protein HS113_30715 [Verrucomicrobiales bacterium]|nr:hypothetical protein [Verrucomicrobiales bacterium]
MVALVLNQLGLLALFRRELGVDGPAHLLHFLLELRRQRIPELAHPLLALAQMLVNALLLLVAEPESVADSPHEIHARADPGAGRATWGTLRRPDLGLGPVELHAHRTGENARGEDDDGRGDSLPGEQRQSPGSVSAA